MTKEVKSVGVCKACGKDILEGEAFETCLTCDAKVHKHCLVRCAQCALEGCKACIKYSNELEEHICSDECLCAAKISIAVGDLAQWLLDSEEDFIDFCMRHQNIYRSLSVCITVSSLDNEAQPKAQLYLGSGDVHASGFISMNDDIKKPLKQHIKTIETDVANEKRKTKKSLR